MSAEQGNHHEISWFQVSRKGSGVGLTIVRDSTSGTTLMVHVLPKFWRPSGSASLVKVEPGTTEVDVFECDTVGLPSPWREHLGQLVDSQPADRSGADEVSSGPKPLWTRAAVPTPTITPRGATCHGAHRAPLWQLVLSRGLSPVQVAGHREHFAGGVPALSRDDTLRPLLKALFVDRVVELLTRRRPQFSGVRESLGVIRGRMVPASLMRRQATRSVPIECDFETLSHDTALWRALRAGLQACVDAPGRSETVLASIARLEDVGMDPVAVVLTRARRVSQGLRDPEQREAHALAVAVLQSDHAPAVDSPDTSGVMVNLTFYTPHLWERIVAQALAALIAPPDEHPSLNLTFLEDAATGAWLAANSKAPDLLLPAGADRPALLIDAKYKPRTAFAQASMSDQYQAIAYATRSGMPTFLVFVDSPRTTDSRSSSPRGWDLRLVPGSGVPRDRKALTDDDLRATGIVGSFSLPFPDPESVGDNSSLNDALRATMDHVSTQVRRLTS